MTSEELKQGVLDSLLRIAERFGVPVVLLAVIIWLGREAAITLHGSLVEPVVKSHVEFLETTSETLKEISSVQTQQAATLEELAHGQRELTDRVKTVTARAVEMPPQN
jgi:methyl-accepting chemotaxis protein